MLNAGKVPAGGILDGGLGERMAGLPAVPAPGYKEVGVGLCEGKVGNVLVLVALLAQLFGGRQQCAWR